MRLSIVIPTWNGGAILGAHMARTAAEARCLTGGCEVVVVDDGSDDALDPVERVVADAGSVARLVRLPLHRGFAPACNAGAQTCRGEHLLFLNNDMELGEGCLDRLLEILEARADVFAVTPVIRNLEGDFPESTTRMVFARGVFDPVFPGRWGEPGPDPGEARRISFACGGALACRRDRFMELGGFSELYAPFFWEDADLGWRARRVGWENLEVGGAAALHDHGRTIGSRFSQRAARRIYERNRLLFTWVHLAGRRGWAAHVAWLPIRWLAAVVRRDPGVAALPDALRRLASVRTNRLAQRASLPGADRLLARVRSSGRGGWPGT